ncbi:MAG: hypothetical protein ACREPV_01410 [Lysobacter sp.]
MSMRSRKAGFCSFVALVAGTFVPLAANAGECEKILGYLQDKSTLGTSRTATRSYERFYCMNEYSTIEEMRNAGGTLGIEVVDIGFSGSTSDFSTYRKEMCEAIRTNTFDNEEVRQTVVRANKSVVDAWGKCISRPGFHFYGEMHSDNERQFVTRALWNSSGRLHSTPARGPIAIQPTGSVECNGDVIQKGTEITPSPLMMNCVRKSNAPITMILSTLDGGDDIQLPAIPPGPAQCPALQTKIFTATGTRAVHPRVEVNVGEGYEIIGGGARVDWTGPGNLLTASYPETSQKWVATAKDHSATGHATVTAWAIAIHDPNDIWEVVHRTDTGETAAHPKSRVTLPTGYALTGGGARVNWSGAGNLLTASYPVDSMTWEARSKDHSGASSANITTYVIGIRPRSCLPIWTGTSISSDEGGVAPHPAASISLPRGLLLTGGGARVNWRGSGNLLTASYPIVGSDGNAIWAAKAKEHSHSSPASVTVYVIGLQR